MGAPPLASPATGRFITFEGIDGAGKSTHLRVLAAQLGERGVQVVCTREPGGTLLAERLRDLVLHRPMDALTEALLVFAARRDHTQRVILPALERGATVLCDRYSDASFAYQGYGRGFDIGLLATLESWVHGGLQPELTLWFDVPPAIAAARRGAARGPDRFEAEDEAFFARVRAGYAARAAAAPNRFVRIDADAPAADVSTRVAAVLEARGW